MESITIPKRTSSLSASSEHLSRLPAAKREELGNIRKRKASALSTLSAASSTSDFVEAKIKNVEADLDYSETLRQALSESYKEGHLSEEQYREACRDLKSDVAPREDELVVLKRQKKVIEDDMQDELPAYRTLEDAYTASLVGKIMGACGKVKKSKFDQTRFRSDALERYNAKSRNEETGEELAWCHLIGWCGAKRVKAAHIVPKTLESDSLAYLFGVGEAKLSDPRNAITLHQIIEGGLDDGTIVLVPKPGNNEGDGETVWICVLVDKKRKTNMITDGTDGVKWKDIDGKELQFLGANRPARRFLYFRFLITYLNCKSKSADLSWLTQVEAKGKMWATPGPYLRKSMLLALARRHAGDDVFLPEAFYEDTTFSDIPEASTKSANDEKVLVLSLGRRIDAHQEAVENRDGDGSEGSVSMDESDTSDNETYVGMGWQSQGYPAPLPYQI